MPLRMLQIFLVVYDLLNMTQAGNQLFISQPAVTQAIQQLERQYGIKLFERVGKRLVRTEASHAFQRFAQKIVTTYQEMDDYFLDYVTNPIKIGSSITIGTVYLPFIMKTFNELYSHIQFHVQIDQSDRIETLVLEHDLDLAIIEGVVHNHKIHSERFMNDSLAVVASSKHPLAGADKITSEVFAEQHFILREMGSGTREILDKKLEKHHIQITPIWESVSTKAIINAVMQGLGISILPKKLVENEIQSGLLTEIHVQGITFDRYLNIIYLRSRQMPTYAEEFIQFLRSYPQI
ncbi:MAG: LysR family transcriptional regulator [Tissierellia bacterium]|nr:LysR family transcriptional regulator [Tissierellia bacterium]